MGRLVITMPAISYARELWRFGEPDLARRASEMTASQCADVGERAGHLILSGEADRLWSHGPPGNSTAILLAVTEYLEGRARPCARTRRLPAKSLPDEWMLTEEELWERSGPVNDEMNSRLHRRWQPPWHKLAVLARRSSARRK